MEYFKATILVLDLSWYNHWTNFLLLVGAGGEGRVLYTPILARFPFGIGKRQDAILRRDAGGREAFYCLWRAHYRIT